MKKLGLLALVLLGCTGVLVLVYVVGVRPNRTPDPVVVWPPPANSDPYLVFQKVVNDCGVCGTNSPVGGWLSYDGRILILREDGTYAFIDTGDADHSGTWKLTGSSMCLSSTLGAQVCFFYQQRVDAMKLDDAIYIRE